MASGVRDGCEAGEGTIACDDVLSQLDYRKLTSALKTALPLLWISGRTLGWFEERLSICGELFLR